MGCCKPAWPAEVTEDDEEGQRYIQKLREELVPCLEHALESSPMSVTWITSDECCTCYRPTKPFDN